jgi:hypothetical protein
VLAELMGPQVARWQQLGFAARRAVLRDVRAGHRGADEDAWRVAIGWARQVLTAPRWWRMIRGVAGRCS